MLPEHVFFAKAKDGKRVRRERDDLIEFLIESSWPILCECERPDPEPF